MGKPPPPKGNRPTRNTPSQPKKQAAKKPAKKPAQPQPPPPPPSSSTSEPAASDSLVGFATQQRLLHIFKAAFSPELSSSDTFSARLQEVKQALFDRDFARVFGDEKYLRIYAARYSPTRALSYAEVLCSLAEHLDGLPRPSEAESEGSSLPVLRTVAIGGGAAEVVAFAACLAREPPRTGSITLVDSGPWGAITDSLAEHLTTPPVLPQYANAEQRANNRALIDPERLTTTFVQNDVLVLDAAGLSALFTPGAPHLVTLFFTLNELFTAGGIGRTTAFLLDLTAAVPSGSLLLVIDSPGSYSETVVGKESKKYPMHWLLDKVLASAENCDWEKLESTDSRWFRLPERLMYPISLENMRYQMHLYRAAKKPSPS